jgi:hypothetical protein
MKGLSLLTTVYSDLEAHIVKGKLADAGIECFVQYSDSISITAARDSVRGIGIYVEPYDLEKASSLLNDSDIELTEDQAD